ncbi:uncharacterized protein LOC126595407, partial [Malus sylvestris]|uniref:uncharacterized protein LOC126595407 n=1 Tax=Malus sylvestris TaxID=3752 RepID=UPI0021ACA639
LSKLCLSNSVSQKVRALEVTEDSLLFLPSAIGTGRVSTGSDSGLLKTRLKEFEKREFLGGFKNSEFVEKFKSSLMKSSASKASPSSSSSNSMRSSNSSREKINSSTSTPSQDIVGESTPPQLPMVATQHTPLTHGGSTNLSNATPKQGGSCSSDQLKGFGAPNKWVGDS